MTLQWGVTIEGFVPKPKETVRAEIDAALQKVLGPSAGVENGMLHSDSVAGQLRDFWTDEIAEQWDQQKAIFDSFNPASATGDSLDAVCSITGTIRKSKSTTKVLATCTGNTGTTLPKGRVASIPLTHARFVSTEDATIAAATAWTGTQGYSVGDKVKNGTPSRIYRCKTAGTSASSPGPTGTSDDITDGTAHWRYLGDGDGFADVPFEAEQFGPVACLVGDLSQIATPAGGWKAITNFADATFIGTLTQTDVSLRTSRENELGAAGNATEAAIRGFVLRCHGVTSCDVFYNDTDFTDSSGVPPHTVDVLVSGDGDPDEIGQALLDSVGAGIGYYGSTSVDIVDGEGVTKTVKFSPPTEVPIYVRVDVTYDPKVFPATGGADLIRDAIVLYGTNVLGQKVGIGKYVRASALEATVFEGPVSSDPGAEPVPGILDVTVLYIKTSPTPTAPTTIAITRRQIATFAIANITVNLTPGTP